MKTLIKVTLKKKYMENLNFQTVSLLIITFWSLNQIFKKLVNRLLRKNNKLNWLIYQSNVSFLKGKKK